MARIKHADYEALAAFHYAVRQFLRFGAEAALEVGLTPQQHAAMVAIKGYPHGRISIGELAEQLQVRHHSVVGLVDRLVAQHLVRREQDAEDRRYVFVTLTPAGAQLIDELAATHRGELKRVASQLIDQLHELFGEHVERRRTMRRPAGRRKRQHSTK